MPSPVHIQLNTTFQHPIDIIFSIASDIQRYPEFIDSCQSVDIIKEEGNVITAKAIFQKLGMHIIAMTENTVQPLRAISVKFMSGSLKSLHVDWQFEAPSHHTCQVTLTLQYCAKNWLEKKMIEKLLGNLRDEMIEAVNKRALFLTAHPH